MTTQGPPAEADTDPGTAPYVPYKTNTLVVERDGPVLVVTINRPERRNAVDSATAAALLSAFEAFEEDDDAQVAVLTGAGGTVRGPAISSGTETWTWPAPSTTRVHNLRAR